MLLKKKIPKCITETGHTSHEERGRRSFLNLNCYWKLSGRQEDRRHSRMGSSQQQGAPRPGKFRTEKGKDCKPAPSFLPLLLSPISSAHCWRLTGLQAHTSCYYFTSHKQKQELTGLQYDVRLLRPSRTSQPLPRYQTSLDPTPSQAAHQAFSPQRSLCSETSLRGLCSEALRPKWVVSSLR